MKTIPSIVAFLLLLNVLAAQPTRPPADAAVPGDTTRPSATAGGLGMAANPGAPSGGLGTGTVTLGSLPASDEFAAGLLSEEAEQDLAAAAAAYRRTIQTFDRQRTEAANAIFRLGEVYRKMGRLEEAKVQYARILREFPDMVRLTELSHGLLLGEEGRPGMDGPVARTTATDSSSVPTSGRGPDDLDRIMRERYGVGISDRIMLERYGLKHPIALDERIACVSNLKQLGLAARIYAAEKGTVYPPSPVLMSDEIPMTKVLVCPSDTTRQPATSWAEFDPALHMTYEYLGAGVRENEPQRTLYRCPIHGHVALVDGSVQPGRAPSPSALEQAQEAPERRVERLGAEPAQSERDTIFTILNRLRQIDGAIQQWALENRQPVGTQPTEQDIIGYLPGGLPVPIAGERYELKPVGEPPVAVLTQPIGNRIRGELIGLGSPAVAADVRPIRIRVKAGGTVELDGKPIELSELIDRLREFSGAPSGRAPAEDRIILLLAEENPPEDAVLAVIDAVLTLKSGRVQVQTTAHPAIQSELERLGKQIDDLREESDRLARRQTDGDRRRVILLQELKEAEAQLRTAGRRLDASRTRPELFPDIINKDERYQRLKQEYEAAVLSLDVEAAKRAQERLKVWVEQIYRPELGAQRDFARDTVSHLDDDLVALDHDFRDWKAGQDRLMQRQRELQTRHSQLALLIPPATGS